MIKQELRTQNQTTLRPRKKGLLVRGCVFPAPLPSRRLSHSFYPPPFWEISAVIYILLLSSSSSYTCQSSMPILQCTSHMPLFLALCELLWPPSHYLGVTSTSMGSGCQLWVFNTKVIASPGVVFLPCSYGWPIGLGISFGILEGIASGDAAPSPFRDFGLPRTRSSSTVYPGSLDSPRSFSGTSSSSAWVLGLI